MNLRKAELRNIMLDIIAGRVKTKYMPDQQAHLFSGVAEVLELRTGRMADPMGIFPSAPELEYADKLLALEIFWDLILDRLITPGADMINPLPFFRVHSEANGF